jgi:hypothetical protein
MRLDHTLRAFVALGLLLSLWGGALARAEPLPASDEASQARLILAQSSGQPGYLPPWQSQPPRADDTAPKPLTPPSQRRSDTYDAPPPAPPSSEPAYGRPYAPPSDRDAYARGRADDDLEPVDPDTYESNEILDAGHRFFGTVSKGLANVVEYAFRKQGRPNGYILGEEAGGAIVAGLRYGEGRLFTKSLGSHKVYWQGPSIGYDFGAEGSKTLILVYNLRDPGEIYERFAGVDGSAYFVGGAGITFQQHGDVILAPIRSGVGLRLGANVGYLKYTPYPTWNPF